MADKKIIERIKALLAMSGDTSSPHEAAIAAKRVAALMAKHNVDMDAIIRHDLESEDSLQEIDFEKKQGKRFERWIQSLAVTIAKSLHCKTTFKVGDSRGHKKLVFQGYETDVVVANWLLGYCYEQIERLAKKESGRGRAYIASFKIGAAQEVMASIREAYPAEIQHTGNGKSLVVVKSQLIQQKYGVAEYGSYRAGASSNDGYTNGRAAGANVAVHRAVEGTAGEQVRRIA